MSDEILTPENPTEEFQEDGEVETPEAASPETITPEAPEASEEPKIPLSRLREEIRKRRELEKELEEKKSPIQPTAPEDDKVKEAEQWIEQKMEALLEKREQTRLEQEQKEDKVLDEVLQEIKDVDSNLNEKDFLDFYSSHRFEDSIDGVWDAYQVYSERNKAKTEKPKPKMPSGIRTNDNAPVEPVDLKKDLYTIKEEALRKFGLKK